MSRQLQPELFAHRDLPEGLVYQPDFISFAEEQDLAAEIRTLEFSEVKMHDVVARRRTIHFGLNYAYETRQVREGPPIPSFLIAVRERLPTLIEIDAAEFVEVLVSEYPPGAGIGWHRDAPMFGIVAGVSLLSECRMRFGLHPSARHDDSDQTRRTKPLDQILAPRSAYVLQGPARTRWQHHIPPTESLRYSITYRTLRFGKKKTDP